MFTPEQCVVLYFHGQISDGCGLLNTEMSYTLNKQLTQCQSVTCLGFN